MVPAAQAMSRSLPSLLARGRAQPRSDPCGAAPGAAVARNGAGDQQRHRRARGLFRRHLPHLTWQPSDLDPHALASIAAHRAAAQLPNLLAPLRSTSPRRAGRSTQADAIVSINMIHIAPWAAAQGLMAGAARLLAPGHVLYPLRAVQGERPAHCAEQRAHSTPACARAIRHGACAIPATFSTLAASMASNSSSASPCRPTI